ncbi:uncharacterized protein B0I36DRAFT_333055 [Microdochium trichocladiopsis]|uniref:Rhodopsin domain-containing protein n=1 Tax=Microdochium trichocladiopsis TaxID=1682393 RepID=A0A9P8XWK4_9PEZI|nr:uncharacterized protein B0I36DRAFT_333055 [Microdochium trichocladiopsis]KAH7020702.1 hypothetical protein B0I36DRAFT_333055 [Microdochium trichocladiopsis]
MSSPDGIPDPSTLGHFSTSPDYKGYEVLGLNVALIVCTTLVVGTRLYVRAFMVKVPGLDDLFAFLSWGCVVALSASEIKSVEYGSGAHVWLVPPELIAKFFESLVNNTLIYFIGTGLMRLSIIAFLPRLSTEVLYTRIGYGVGLLIIAQTLGCFFYRLTECKPIKDIWLVPTTPGLNCVTPQEENTMMVAHQAIGIIIDIALLALPICIIWKKMLHSNKKIQVVLIFSIGIFVVVTGIVRIIMLKTLLFLEDPTYNMSTIGPWTDLEGHIGLWCASFPALHPILRLVSYKLGLRSNPLSSKKTLSKTPNTRDTRQQATYRKSKGGYIQSGYGIDADDGSERGIVAVSAKGMEMDNLDIGTDKIYKHTGFHMQVDKVIPA